MIKRIFLLLLLLLQCFLLHSQETSTAQLGLTSIESTLIQLENNSLEQKSIIENLQKDLEASQQTCANLENLRIEMSMELENASKLLKKQELSLKRWKIAFMVVIPLTAITTTGILIIATKG